MLIKKNERTRLTKKGQKRQEQIKKGVSNWWKRIDGDSIH